MITSPISRPITSRIASAIAGARVGGVSYDYYVDSVNGNDANDGATASAPFETIAAAVTAGGASTDGLKIGLARGSHWRESLVLTGDNVTVAAYGSGTMPILDAGDVASTFTKTGGQTNVYQIDWTPEDAPESGKSNISVIEHNGTEIAKLARVYSLGDCDTTPGSWYANYSSNAVSSTQTIYIHTPDSADPDANGRTYTIPSRNYGVYLGGYNCTLKDVRTRQNLHNNGSLVVQDAKLVKGCVAEYGHVHNAGVYSGLVEDCIFWETCPISTGFGTHTMFVAYAQSGVGRSITVRRSVFSNSSYPDVSFSGFYSHTLSNETPYDSITLEDNAYYNIVGCVSMGNNPLQYRDYRTRAENINTVLSSSALDIEVYDAYVRGATTNARLFQLQGILDGIRIYTPSQFSGGAFGTAFKSGSEVRNSVLVASRTAPVSDCIYDTSSTADITFNNNIMVSWRHHILASDAAAVYEGDNNVFYNISGWSWHGVSIPSLATWQSTTGQDANSVTTDPQLTDPANGDFTPQAEGLPTVGLLRPNITYTEVPSKATIEAM